MLLSPSYRPGHFALICITFAVFAFARPSGEGSSSHSSSSPSKTRLFLVRHGQTHSNVKGNIQGLRDGPDDQLTEQGKAEIHKTANALKHVPIHEIVSCGLTRTRHTADAIAAHHPHASYHTDPRLPGQDFGEKTGKRLDSVDFTDKNWEHHIKGMESTSNYKGRTKDFLSDVAARPASKFVHNGVKNVRPEGHVAHRDPSGHRNVAVVTHQWSVNNMLDHLHDTGISKSAPGVHRKISSGAAIAEIEIQNAHKLPHKDGKVHLEKLEGGRTPHGSAITIKKWNDPAGELTMMIHQDY